MSVYSHSIEEATMASLDYPALICKIFFGSGSIIAIFGTAFPAFRQYIMNYGPRSIEPTPSIAKSSSTKSTSLDNFSTTKSKNGLSSLLTDLISSIGSYRVSHAWFRHYYAVSMISSAFWAHQIMMHGSAIQFFERLSLASLPPKASSPRLLMSADQVLLTWSLMAFQGMRRFYECNTLTKYSKSTMWIGLYIIGGMFYIFMGVAVWIEGIQTIHSLSLQSSNPDSSPFMSIQPSMPSPKTATLLFIFMLASLSQHISHNHLSTLKKYTLPSHFLFARVVCPHYTCECIIYSLLALLAAPQGSFFNGTLLLAAIFVFSNLAATADSTWLWYKEKFGQESLRGKHRMVPFLF